MERAPEACIVCGSKSRDLLVEKDSWTVYRCAECGLGFLDPRPSRQEIEALYHREYFAEQYDQGLDPGSSRFAQRIRGETHRVRFVGREKRTGRLLDFGCGYGYFLYACRAAGYDVQGVELGEWARQYAVQKLELDVRADDPDRVVRPQDRFDIITMWHFLEHMEQPDSVLRRANSWLRGDGILVIDVPNYEGTDARHRWQAWEGWAPPYHLWHFTRSSLISLLSKSGFRVVRTKDYHSDVIKQRLSPLRFLRPFARMVSKLYSGSIVAVIAVKDAGTKAG